MTLEEALSEFADLLTVGAAALKTIAERHAQTSPTKEVDRYLSELKGIADRLLEIGAAIDKSVG